MNSLPDEWLNAYNAGVFTEFQEQRAPGHTVLGSKIYQLGMTDMITQTEEEISRLYPRSRTTLEMT